MVMVLRPKSKASLPSQHHYTRVNVEPRHEHDARRAQPLDMRSKLLGWMRRAFLVLALLALPVFLLIWYHLFAIDVESVLAESRGGSSVEKTFTVR